ncbi:hypothetical protein I7007_001336 [Campylobacter jejuni]|nr:hypothetical protein [Campylobacter jejuni]EDP2897615.1 hypothetical protein [Campylobacter jejuni]EGR9265350.1 hypothetical protein [Campylobacter jejuni]
MVFKKKIASVILAPALIFSISLANDSDDILKFYNSKLKSVAPNAVASIDSVKSIENGFEEIIINVKIDDVVKKDVIFKNNGFIMPDLVDFKNQTSVKAKILKELNQDEKMTEQTKILSALKNESKMVTLGDKSKPEIYVITDPVCPFCRNHMAKIDDILKTHRVHFVFISVHGKEGFEKSALIYKEVANVKNDTDKLKIIKHYYDPKTIDYPKVSAKDYDSMLELFNKYVKLGFNAVPYIVEGENK